MWFSKTIDFDYAQSDLVNPPKHSDFQRQTVTLSVVEGVGKTD